jgi:hypothetical protein
MRGHEAGQSMVDPLFQNSWETVSAGRREKQYSGTLEPSLHGEKHSNAFCSLFCSFCGLRCRLPEHEGLC